MPSEEESAGQHHISFALESIHNEALTDELPSGRKTAQSTSSEYLKIDMSTAPTDSEHEVGILL